MTRRGSIARVRAAFCAVVATLAAVSCGVPTESSPQPIAADRLPPSLQNEFVTESTASSQFPVTLWLVKDDHLVSVVHRVDEQPTVESTLATLGSGPTDDDQSHTLRSAIPDDNLIVSVEVGGGTATVELDKSFDQIPPQDQVLAIGQLVLTLTDLRGIGQVRFLLSGAEIAVPLPDGRTAVPPVSADDFRAIIAA